MVPSTKEELKLRQDAKGMLHLRENNLEKVC